MAEYCRECADDLGFDPTELAGLCAPGEAATVICEGCGGAFVDHEGWCLGPCDGSYVDGPHGARHAP